MLDVMPKKLISRDDLNNWEKYLANLDKYYFVKKYLVDIFKLWIKNLENPLEVSWIQHVFKDRFDITWLNEKLEDFEQLLGGDNLKSLLNELNIGTKYSSEISKKIDSLFGEIITYKLFGGREANLEKIEKIGDWGNDRLIVSVKTIMTKDLNYKLIENSLRGSYFIKENSILRDYNRIRLADEKSVDDSFRIKVIWLIATSFVDLLKFCESMLDRFFDVKSSLVKLYSEATQGYLSVEIQAYKDTNRTTVVVFLKEDRQNEESNKHQIRINLENEFKNDKPVSSGSYDSGAWWGDPQLDLGFLKLRVPGLLKEFDRQYEQREEKEFFGWINVGIHSMHRNYISGDNEIESILKDIKGDRPYSLTVALDYSSDNVKLIKI